MEKVNTYQQLNPQNVNTNYNLIACDVGGTFCDFISINKKDKMQISVYKIASTPQDPAQAVEQGLQISNQSWSSFLHGTTIATNMLLERKGAKIILITTEGFSDIIEIGRQNRMELYRPADRPKPLIPRKWRIEAPERISATGEVIRPLDYQLLKEHLLKIPDTDDIQAIAVCLLFSFLNPTHEQQIRNIVREIFPKDTYVALSSEIFPVFREYERTSTTVLDAYVAPTVTYYLQNLKKRLKQFVSKIHIMQSNGGMSTPETLQPAQTLLSGLAGGILGAKYSGEKCQEPNIISLDIGGTSTDVGLIKNLELKVTMDSKINGLPLALPSLSVETVGAGGGSIAYLDRQKLLQVGPQSAGADPGPICYGKGGKQICITDVDLFLGWLSPDNFAGGTVNLYPNLIPKGIEKLANQLDLTPTKLASGIQEIFHNNVAQALRRVSIERGHDPRDFTLVVFGGAGPTHACPIAELLSIPKILIPPYPGIWSAFGLITADFRYDHQISVISSFKDVSRDLLAKHFENLKEKGMKKLLEANFDVKEIKFKRYADLRYYGQSYELRVIYPDPTVLLPDRTLFDHLHEQEYGFFNSKETLELVNIGVIATGIVSQISFPPLPKGGKTNPKKSFLHQREITWNNTSLLVSVYLRENLLANDKLIGPCIIEQDDTTTVVGPKWNITVLENGHLLMRNEE
ncbi:MAG: hydantoinase/oxoprolinase family protein [Candidatus Hodarchaeales archaeon]